MLCAGNSHNESVCGWIRSNQEDSVKVVDTAQVDAFLYPKTEAQQQDQQVFFKETLQRLASRLEHNSQLKF